MTTPSGYRDHNLIGLPDQVANVIRNHQRAGTLVSLTPPRPVSPTDPRVRCALRVVDTTAASPATPTGQSRSVHARRVRVKTTRVTRRITRRQVAIATAVTTVAAAALTAVAYLVYELVQFVVEHAALIIGVLVLAALVLIAIGRSSGGGGRHCPGC